MAIRERPKLVWIEVFHPARPYCSPKAMQKRINTPLITRVANIRDAHSFAVICLFFPCFVVRISTSVFMLYSLEKTIDTAIIITSRAGMAIVRVEPQKQRVAIARAIVCGAETILADEPTGALDSKTGNEIMRVFSELNNMGKTVILITHDKNVASYAKRLITIQDGRILGDEEI